MENKQRLTPEKEVNLLPLLKAIWPKMWLMILVGLIVGCAAFGATKLMIKPTYRSSFTAYINNQHTQQSKDSVTYSDLNAAQQLTRTYSYMLRSSSILRAAADSIGSDLSYDQLKLKVSTEIRDETEIIIIHVVDTDAEFAYNLATAISKIAPGYMADFVEGSSMKIIDPPVLNTNRYGPSYLKFGVVGFLGGFLIVLAIVMIAYFRDDKIKSEHDIEARFGAPILGIIPDVLNSKNGTNGYEYHYAYQRGADKE